MPSSGSRGRIAFAPDSRTLAVCALDPVHSIELWDVGAKEKIREFPGAFNAMTISPDGQWLAAGGIDGLLKLWNLRTGEGYWTNQAHLSETYGLTFSSDSRRLATAAFDQVIHVWDMAKKERMQTFRGHLNEIWSLEFSPDHRFLVSASKDGSVRLWDTRAQRRPTRWWMDTADLFLGFASDGRRLATVTTNGAALHYWDGPEITKAVPLEEPLSADELDWPGLSSKSASLGVVATNGLLRTYSAETGRLIRSAVKLSEESGSFYRLYSHERWVARAAKATDGSWGIHVWDAASGASVGRFSGHYVAALSSDERLLAVASTNLTVQVWDIGASKLVHSFSGHSWYIDCLSFSKDDRYLASSSGDGDIRVWDLATDKEMVAPLRGHGSGIPNVCFSSDGKTLFSCGFDNTVRFWQMPTGREMLLFDRARDNSQALPGKNVGVWSPTDQLLALWDMDRQALRVETIPTIAEIEEVEKSKEQFK